MVHGVGAWTALVGVWIVGPRIGRFSKDGEVQRMPGSSTAISVLGVLILWFGWWGFNGGSNLALNGKVGSIILVTNLSGAAAGITAFIHSFFIQKKDAIHEKFLGGILGGLVAITAGCNVISPLEAVVVGAVAGLIHNLSYDLLLKKLKLDDVVGAVPVHGFCGAWGTLAVALFGQVDAFGGNTRWEQLGIQMVGVATCFVWTTTIAGIMYRVLKSTVGLRVPPEHEIAGLSLLREYDDLDEHKNENLDEETILKMMPK